VPDGAVALLPTSADAVRWAGLTRWPTMHETLGRVMDVGRDGAYDAVRCMYA
jgi:hypothetical protein